MNFVILIAINTLRSYNSPMISVFFYLSLLQSWLIGTLSLGIKYLVTGIGGQLNEPKATCNRIKQYKW